MINVLLLPDASVLTLLDMTVDAPSRTITAVAATTSPQASCPVCHQPSSKVQSRYVRRLADLPCSGQQVRWLDGGVPATETAKSTRDFHFPTFCS